jgi:hypothetical protein
MSFLFPLFLAVLGLAIGGGLLFATVKVQSLQSTEAPILAERQAKIGVAVMKLLAIAVPIGFLTLAILAFTSSWSQSKADESDMEATLEIVANVKSPSYSEKSRAAKKLSETPVKKNLVNEVAPELNVLLESKNTFYQDNAIAAIKQGWGSSANEAALRRIQQNTEDARILRDVDAALKRIAR